MLKALWYKELRETIGITLAALLAYVAFVSGCTGYDVLPFRMGERDQTIPFLQGNFPGSFCLVSVCLAIALGLRQTAWESGRGTWPYLLHRPISRRQLIGVKLVTGAGLYLLCAALPILAYAAWAATPGTHASPFEWWMTVPVWKSWLVITLVYLGAFLAGIRPGRWIGTRLLPLPVAGVLAMLTWGVWSEPPGWWKLFGIPALILAGGLLLSLIYFVARTRDYS